jgi:hypothetical protein
MPLRQKVIFLTVALVLLLAIFELVRRRRLRVEYSWVWLAAGASIVVLILRYDLLVELTALVGAVVPTSTLFLLCILYLALLSLDYSVRLSSLRWQVKELAQQVALLKERCGGPAPEELEGKTAGQTPPATRQQ